MLVGLNTGRDTMISHGLALATVSDNIANSNTVGFKTNRAEFADLLAESIGGLYSTPGMSPGNGALVTAIARMNHQGILEMTGREYDFAIDGKGYFITQATDGTTYYTRAGNFLIDAEGYLVTLENAKVLGYAPGGATLQPLQVNGVIVPPQATTTVTMAGTLSSASPNVALPVQPTTYSDLSSSASFHSFAQVFDSQGQLRTLDFYYFKTADFTWEVQMYADAKDLGGVSGEPVLMGSATLNFPLAAGNTMSLNTAWANGATSNINFDLDGYFSLSGPSAMFSLYADGFAGGVVESIRVTDTGVIYGYLNTGTAAIIGEFALVNFENPDSLQRIGTNRYIAGYDTVIASIGRPGDEGRGQMKGRTLELSNVDMAGQFVELIRFQRGYQAGSKVVQTLSELIHVTLNIL